MSDTGSEPVQILMSPACHDAFVRLINTSPPGYRREWSPLLAMFVDRPARLVPNRQNRRKAARLARIP